MKEIVKISDNFIDHIAAEQRNLYVSIWNTGRNETHKDNKKRQQAIETIDDLMSELIARRECPNGNLSIQDIEALTMQLYTIFRRYVFSTIAAFFRGYYDISLANARVAFEASMYAYICFYDKELKSEYKLKKQLWSLFDKFDKMTKKQGFGEISLLQTVYNLCNERGAHCDYRLIEETTLSGKGEILLPLNDLPDEASGEFNRKIFEILRGFLVSLEVFNSLLNSGDVEFANLISKKILQVNSSMKDI
jgi:hypothetical protein